MDSRVPHPVLGAFEAAVAAASDNTPFTMEPAVHLFKLTERGFASYTCCLDEHARRRQNQSVFHEDQSLSGDFLLPRERTARERHTLLVNGGRL